MRTTRHLMLSYRGKVIYIAVGLIIALGSLVYTRHIARMIESKERYEIEMWASGFAMSDGFVPRSAIESELMYALINPSTNIPIIVTDEYLKVIAYQNIDISKFKTEKQLRAQLIKMSKNRVPITLRLYEGRQITVFYSDSILLASLHFFPYVQMGIIIILIGFAFITFSSTQQNEQNRIWVGMAKETAHQLGTPTSSLLGWVDYLKSMDVMPDVTCEMSRDLARLTQVADRFGKIGSSTNHVSHDMVKVVAGAVDYFKTRIPRKVTLNFDHTDETPMIATVNESLFGWVIENILKNALDALQGDGRIDVTMEMDSKWITIDIHDTGKGIPKSSFQKIFRPGYSTKTRGWGLGLSLSRRIVEDYHNGRIFVLNSEIDLGTTFRVMLRRFDKQKNPMKLVPKFLKSIFSK